MEARDIYSAASDLGLHCLTMSKKRALGLLGLSSRQRAGIVVFLAIQQNWAASRENLSSGFPIKQGSNPPAQLRKLQCS